MSSRSSGGLSDGAPSPPERSQGWDIRLSGHIDSSAPKAELGALAAHHLTTTHLKTHCPYRCGGGLRGGEVQGRTAPPPYVAGRSCEVFGSLLLVRRFLRAHRLVSRKFGCSPVASTSKSVSVSQQIYLQTFLGGSREE